MQSVEKAASSTILWIYGMTRLEIEPRTIGEYYTQ